MSLSMVLKDTVSQAVFYMNSVHYMETWKKQKTLAPAGLRYTLYSSLFLYFLTKKRLACLLYQDSRQQQIKLSSSHHFQYEPVTVVLTTIDFCSLYRKASTPGLQLWGESASQSHAKTISVILPGGQTGSTLKSYGPITQAEATAGTRQPHGKS